jgi:hypothetical protein
MSRVELEVERNVLELNLLLPDPPPVDRHFYADVWLPQEIQHGLLLDRLQLLHNDRRRRRNQPVRRTDRPPGTRAPLGPASRPARPHLRPGLAPNRCPPV